MDQEKDKEQIKQKQAINKSTFAQNNKQVSETSTPNANTISTYTCTPIANTNTNTNKTTDITTKQMLKQQAKQLLLKQCYKMSMNKYLRLIQLGPQGFTCRQWSIIYLNTAITLQYQQKLKQSLQKINNAIQIDPSYQKAYYRRLQVLEQLGQYQLVLNDNIVPNWIRNKEIQELRIEIQRKYRSNVGFQELENKMGNNGFLQEVMQGNIGKMGKFVELGYQGVFQRITNQIQKQGQSKQQKQKYVSKISKQIADHYSHIYEKSQQINKYNNYKNWLNKFYLNIYKLCVNNAISTNNHNNLQLYNKILILDNFWQMYSKNFIKQIKNNEQLKQILMMGHQSQDQQQQKQNNRNDEKGKQSYYEKILLLYCPLLITNSQYFIKIFKTAQNIINAYIKSEKFSQNSQKQIKIQQLLKNLLKILYNNSTYFDRISIHHSQQKQNNNYKRLELFVDCVDKWIADIVSQQQLLIQNNNSTMNSCVFYQQIQLIAENMLNLEHKLIKQQIKNNKSGNIKQKVRQYKQNQLFTMLYRIKHQLLLSFNNNQQITINALKCIHNLMLFSYKNNNKNNNNQCKFIDLYQINKTMHRIKIQQLIKLKQSDNQEYKMLELFVFQLLNKQCVILSKLLQLQQSQRNKESIRNSILNIICLTNTLNTLNPIYLSKYLTQNIKQVNNNNKNNTQNSSQTTTLQKMLALICNIPIIINNYLKNIKNNYQILALYLESVSGLVIAYTEYLRIVLQVGENGVAILVSKICDNNNNNNRSIQSDKNSIKNNNKNNINKQFLSISVYKNIIKLLYVLIIDFTHQQQQFYAQKMGVSQQQILKAKKLQGESYKNQENLTKIKTLRKKVISQITAKFSDSQGSKKVLNKNEDDINFNWLNVIIKLATAISSSSSSSVFTQRQSIQNTMLISIIQTLSEHQPNKFYSPVITSYMIQKYKQFQKLTHSSQNPSSNPKSYNYKNTCYKISQFFTSISKKINNINIFSYPQLQPICNILCYGIENGKHQLHIFQAFLGLVHFSSKKQVKIGLNVVQIGLLEQNYYIVHGAMEVFNNILVNFQYQGVNEDMEKGGNEGKKYWGKLFRLSQFVIKYYKHYHQIISNQQINNSKQAVTDYSHPYKIYCTILSVLLLLQPILMLKNEQNPNMQQKSKQIIIQLNSIQQLKQWKTINRNLKYIQKNNGDIGLCLFKLVLHHAESKTLPAGWFKGFQNTITIMKERDLDKWGKLQKYVK